MACANQAIVTHPMEAQRSASQPLAIWASVLRHLADNESNNVDTVNGQRCETNAACASGNCYTYDGDINAYCRPATGYIRK